MGNVIRRCINLVSWVPSWYLLLVVCFLAGYALSRARAILPTSQPPRLASLFKNSGVFSSRFQGGASWRLTKRTKAIARYPTCAAIN